MKNRKEEMLKNFSRSYQYLKEFFSNNTNTKIGSGVLILFCSIFVISKMSEQNKVVYKEVRNPTFNDGRILGAQTSSYLKNKEIQLSKAAKRIMAQNKLLEDRIKRLEAKK